MRQSIAKRSTRDRVANALAQCMDLRRATSRRMACVLILRPRTMRRQLAAAGTSWSRLLDAERLSRAEAAAARGITRPAALAELVGYAENNSFLRAYQRWHGRTFTGRTRSSA